MSDWCTIESDPGVFSELICQFGVKNVAVEEIYSLNPQEQDDKENMKSHGLIFLFKWQPSNNTTTRNDNRVIDPNVLPDLFFAKQTVTNACATQAILSVLMNAQSVDLGEVLEDFKAFAVHLDCESRGISIGNSDFIREAHNSFARPEPFLVEKSSRRALSSDDVYHFVAFVPFKGVVYELDGLKSGPIPLGMFADNDWWSVAKPAIQNKMEQYSASETHFALLSIGEKRSFCLERDLAIVHTILTERGQMISPDASAVATSEEVLLDADVPVRMTELRKFSSETLQDLVYRWREDLQNERMKEERQKIENIRRRHNYIPFILTLLKEMAEGGTLTTM